MVARPFHADPVLTAISVGYRNEAAMLIADAALPRVPVGAREFSWTRYPIAQAFTVPRTQVGRRGRVERVEFSGKQEASECYDYALEDGIPIDDIRNAETMRARGLGTFNPLDQATMSLTDIILLDREVRTATVLQNTASYSANKRIVLSGSDQFSNVNSDIIGTLKAAFGSTLIYRPNTMTMGRDVWTGISSHPQLVNAIKGNVTSKGIITPAEFVELFRGEGLTKLNIGESFVNVARPGQNANLSRVWGNFIALTYINPVATPMNRGVTFGFTAQYGTRIAGQWEDHDVGADGGQVVRVGERLPELVVAPDVGFLIQNPVAAVAPPTIVPYEPPAAA